MGWGERGGWIDGWRLVCGKLVDGWVGVEYGEVCGLMVVVL